MYTNQTGQPAPLAALNYTDLVAQAAQAPTLTDDGRIALLEVVLQMAAGRGALSAATAQFQKFLWRCSGVGTTMECETKGGSTLAPLHPETRLWGGGMTDLCCVRREGSPGWTPGCSTTATGRCWTS